MKHRFPHFLCLAFSFCILCLIPPALAQEPVTITLATWTEGQEAEQLQGILDQINNSQSEFRIVHESIPSDYYTQLQSQIVGDSGADLYWVDEFNMGLAAQGLFLPIDQCVAGAEPQSAADLNDYFPGILQSVELGGEVYGLPFAANPVVTYYNRDLFDAAGLSYPSPDWTWDEFLATAQALTIDTNGDGQPDQWGFTANGWPPPAIFIWQTGGDLVSADLTQSPIDSPEVLAGLEFYRQLAFNPGVSPDQNTIAAQGLRDMFVAGKVAMYMGNADEDLDRIDGLNVGLVRVPGYPGTDDHTTYAWSAATVINANVANADLACKALLAITEGVQNWKILSPRISQNTVEHLVTLEPQKSANADAIVQAALTMRTLRIFGNFQDWNNTLWHDFLTPIIDGTIGETETADVLGNPNLSLADFARAFRPELEAHLNQ